VVVVVVASLSLLKEYVVVAKDELMYSLLIDGIDFMSHMMMSKGVCA
jgi:hypothetical protein